MQFKANKILYLGLDPSRYPHDGELVHVPLIRIAPRPFVDKVKEAFEQMEGYTHVVLTSRTGASLYSDYAVRARQHVLSKQYISVGTSTTELLEERGIVVQHTALEQTAEGVIEVLKRLDLQKGHLFFPRSALGRDLIPLYCKEKQIRLTLLDLYDICPNDVQLPDLASFDQIVFTSPSIVHAFFERIKEPPRQEICHPIGPVTAATLDRFFRN